MNTSLKEQAIRQEHDSSGLIYIKHLNQLVPVNQELYKWHKNDIQVYLRRMQRKGLCSCTAVNWWKCDKDCCCCSFRRGSEFISIEESYSDSEGIALIESIPCENPTPQEIVEEQEIRFRLHDAINKLPPNQREICNLWNQGLSEDKIALHLNYSSRNAVFEQLQRAKNNLQFYLSDYL